MILHLLRHGPPIRPGLLLGHTDDPACDADGIALLPALDTLTIERIVTSDLQRACRAAEALAASRAVPLAVDPRWRELHFGAWDGLAPEAVPAADLARFWDDPDACPPPGGESWSALKDRVRKAMAELAGGKLADGTLVVTHAGAMRAAVSCLTGLDHRAVWALDLPYGALLSLRIWPGETLAGQIVGLRSGAAR